MDTKITRKEGKVGKPELQKTEAEKNIWKTGLLMGKCTRLNKHVTKQVCIAYILTRSPSFRVTSGSLFKGEKWQTQLFTDTQVGKAIPVRGGKQSREEGLDHEGEKKHD